MLCCLWLFFSDRNRDTLGFFVASVLAADRLAAVWEEFLAATTATTGDERAGDVAGRPAEAATDTRPERAGFPAK